jgi:hypothetical protein
MLTINFVCAQTYFIEHDFDQVKIEKNGALYSLDYLAEINLSSLGEEIDQPDLPVYIYKILLPGNTTINSYSIEAIKEIELEGSFNIEPKKKLWTQFTKKAELKQNTGQYSKDKQFPEQAVKYLGVKHFNGLPIAHFAVYPLRYNAQNGKLHFIKQIQLSISTMQDSYQAIKPERLDSSQKTAISEYVAKSFRNRNDLNEVTVVEDVDAFEIKQLQEDLGPGLIERYIIITNESLKDAFIPLAEWKTRKGVLAVIRTVEWICEQYPNGVDEAEKIRSFIQRAYQKKGTKYVLLGGDIDIVPTREITTNECTFAADYYYSDLDGTWNDDQDNIFGEAVDNVDGYPEVYVGRIPVQTNEEVQRFIYKLFNYEKLTNIVNEAFPENVLYIAANLENDNDGRDLIMNHIDPYINPDFTRKLITQNDDIGSSPDVAIAELNKNYAIIFSETHGSYHTVRPGARNSNIYNYHLVDLYDQDPSFWYVASCHTNDILRRSFSEVYLLAENGGGVAYIGNSSFEHPFSGIYLEKEFYRLAFEEEHYHLSEAHFLSRLPYLGYIGWEGPTRVIVFSTIVLGDPEMPLWTDTPQTFLVVHPDSLAAGENQFTVQVKNAVDETPVEQAKVVLYRNDDVYKTCITNDSGIVNFDEDIYKLGTVNITVTKRNYIPFESEMIIYDQPVPRIELKQYFVDDGGNQNQQCEPGETINLTLKVVNEGSQAVEQNLTANLNCSHPLVSMEIDEIDTAITLQSLESVFIGPFRFTISAELPADTTLLFETSFDADTNKAGSGSILLDAGLPELYITGQSTFKPTGFPANYSGIKLELFNFGTGAATQVEARFSSAQDSVQLIDSLLSFGNIEPNKSKQSPDECIIEHNIPLDSIQLNVCITDIYGKEWNFCVDFNEPEPPVNFTFKPENGYSIQLSWQTSPSADVAGYHINRREKGGEDFQRITYKPLPQAGYFIDDNLGEDLTFEYTVQALDFSGNLSMAPSDTITAWPTLPFQNGFPFAVSLKAIGSVMNGTAVYDFDGDGKKEIAASGFNGVLNIYEQDGTLLWQVESLTSALTVPAVGNVFGDESAEIVVSGYKEGAYQNFIFIVNSITGTLIDTLHLGYNVPTSVVLKDIDRDGLDDIIVLTHGCNAPEPPKNSRLFIWRSTGTEWQPFPGWPADGYVFTSTTCLGMPAAADMNNSGVISVIVGTYDGKIYLFNPFLSPDPVWISELSGSLNSPISLADIDLDGSLDIIAPSINENKLFIVNNSGEALPGWENGQDIEATDHWGYGSPAVAGNLDSDDQLEIVYVGGQHAYIFEHTGDLKEGWPIPIDNNNSIFSSPVLADLDYNGITELIFGTEYGVLNALDCQNGKNISGFPIHTGNELIQGQSPAIMDVDKDGDLDILFTGHDGVLNIWDAPGKYPEGSVVCWHQPFANVRHTGELDTLKMEIISNIWTDKELRRIPDQFYLKNNYPNPFNPQTTIEFGLSQTAEVDLTVFNILGQQVCTLVSERRKAGKYHAVWNGKNTNGQTLSSGIYFYRLKVKDAETQNTLFTRISKMILLK